MNKLDNDVINFPEKSIIRSIEEIIRQDEEKKDQDNKRPGINQIFNAAVQNVINIEPGASITIVMETKRGKQS